MIECRITDAFNDARLLKLCKTAPRPKTHPTLLSLSPMISQYFMRQILSGDGCLEATILSPQKLNLTCSSNRIAIGQRI